MKKSLSCINNVLKGVMFLCLLKKIENIEKFFRGREIARGAEGEILGWKEFKEKLLKAKVNDN